MYISRERWKRKEKNARYVFRVRMRDVSVRKISRRRDIWEENCVKGEEEEHRIETARSIIRWNSIAQASPASRRKRSRWKQGGGTLGWENTWKSVSNEVRYWKIEPVEIYVVSGPFTCNALNRRWLSLRKAAYACHYPGATMSRRGWNREAILCHKRVETVSRIRGIDASFFSPNERRFKNFANRLKVKIIQISFKREKLLIPRIEVLNHDNWRWRLTSQTRRICVTTTPNSNFSTRFSRLDFANCNDFKICEIICIVVKEGRVLSGDAVITGRKRRYRGTERRNGWS